MPLRPLLAKPKRHVEKELIIHSTQSEVEIALLEDGKLVELHHEELSNDFAVGDIFLGKIRKLTPLLWTLVTKKMRFCTTQTWDRNSKTC
jgi:hypothetical protein